MDPRKPSDKSKGESKHSGWAFWLIYLAAAIFFGLFLYYFGHLLPESWPFRKP